MPDLGRIPRSASKTLHLFRLYDVRHAGTSAAEVVIFEERLSVGDLIRSAMRNSGFVLAFLSDASFQSECCAFELDTATALDTRRTPWSFLCSRQSAQSYTTRLAVDGSPRVGGVRHRGVT